jgi:hypothetical protein
MTAAHFSGTDLFLRARAAGSAANATEPRLPGEPLGHEVDQGIALGAEIRTAAGVSEYLYSVAH